MREHRLRHLPVVVDARVVGVVSQRDLYLLETLPGADLDDDRVSDAMSREIYIVEANTSVRDVARGMAYGRYGCAVVVEGGRVCGIFTTTDALEFIADALPADAS